MNLQNNVLVTLLLSSVILSGCSYSTTLSPPVDSRKIHFFATVPDDLESLPLSAMYRSEKCRKTRTKGNGDSYTVPGFNAEKYPLTRVSPGVFSADIPVEGGGNCDWTLSNIKLEVKLKNPQGVDAEITKNHGFETVFITDNNAPQAFNGGYENHRGDFSKSILLFPYMTERFISEHKKIFWLIGESDMLTYRLSGSDNIHLTVNYEKNMMSYRTGAKKKKSDDSIENTPENIPFITYPNGNIEYNSDVYPNYKKLLSIRDAMQKK